MLASTVWTPLWKACSDRLTITYALGLFRRALFSANHQLEMSPTSLQNASRLLLMIRARSKADRAGAFAATPNLIRPCPALPCGSRGGRLSFKF